MAIWLTALVVIVIGMSLVIHTLSPRVGATFRFLSICLQRSLVQPGCWCGCSCCNPAEPVDFVLSALGTERLAPH